jgi:hypothetical protein
MKQLKKMSVIKKKSKQYPVFSIRRSSSGKRYVLGAYISKKCDYPKLRVKPWVDSNFEFDLVDLGVIKVMSSETNNYCITEPATATYVRTLSDNLDDSIQKVKNLLKDVNGQKYYFLEDNIEY